MTKKVLTFLLTLCITSFAQIPTAAPDTTYGGHTAPSIVPLAFPGDCGTSVYEAVYPPLASSTMVVVKMNPCGWSVNQHGDYRLTSAINLQSIGCWIGTSANARFETVAQLQIWTPDGLHMMWDWECEFDKHQDVLGMLHIDRTFPLGMKIPSGAIVKFYRYPGGLIFCGANPDPLGPNASVSTTWDKCATEIHWRLYGTGN